MHQNLKDQFLKQVIYKAELGSWNQEMLQSTSIEIGLAPNHYRLWFPEGAKDVINFLESTYDQEMLEILSGADQINGISAKIRFAVKIRICKTSRSKLLAIKNSNFYLTPFNQKLALNIAWRSVDLIWRYAGDTALDFNYYSKRTLLQGVYLASQTYYNLDSSEGDYLTQEFIDKALDTVLQGVKTLKQTPELLKKIPFLRILL
jgi:ubiquinone biosynthesis protein COQ9